MQHEPTSEEIDRQIEEHPDSFSRLPPQTGVRIHVEVPLDRATLTLLQERADREGRPFADVVSDAVRAGADAA